MNARMLAWLLLSCPLACLADIYPLPSADNALIGEEDVILARQEDTLVDIAREHGLGFDEIVNANPAVDTWLPRAGTPVVLPLRHILPASPREGIVVNTAEMRLYYFPRARNGETATVESYPISIGRSDWNTPLVTTKVTRKVADPVWYPPSSLREERLRQGDPPLPEAVHPGPDNPLGQYALYLGTPSYLIHGTNKEYGIGMQVTHGCMRMYPEDIQRLYTLVPVGTPVRIVNQPFKVGWEAGVLFLEVHPWPEGLRTTSEPDEALIRQLIQQALSAFPDYPVDWHAVELLQIEASGRPAAIGPRIQPLVIRPATQE